jgi:hypothetical protein
MSISQSPLGLSSDPEERRRRPKVEAKAPVREERTIGEILETLVGAPREAWLNKWRRWIAELIDNYDLKTRKRLGMTKPKLRNSLKNTVLI